MVQRSPPMFKWLCKKSHVLFSKDEVIVCEYQIYKHLPQYLCLSYKITPQTNHFQSNASMSLILNETSINSESLTTVHYWPVSCTCAWYVYKAILTINQFEYRYILLALFTFATKQKHLLKHTKLNPLQNSFLWPRKCEGSLVKGNICYKKVASARLTTQSKRPNSCVHNIMYTNDFVKHSQVYSSHHFLHLSQDLEWCISSKTLHNLQTFKLGEAHNVFGNLGPSF